MNPLQRYDSERLAGCRQLVGVDEAGRGCLAGPVVAGACILTKVFFEQKQSIERSHSVNDSKQLSAEARAEQFEFLKQLQEENLIHFSVAPATVEEIEELNILGATRLAMQRALEALASRNENWVLPYPSEPGPRILAAPEMKIIVDGRPLKPFPYAHEGVVKGDGRSLCIAMAGIAAKVSRDHMMRALDKDYPEYGLAKNKGYGTPTHRTALRAHGATPIHRKLFLRKVL